MGPEASLKQVMGQPRGGRGLNQSQIPVFWTEICSGSEVGSYFRLVDLSLKQEMIHTSRR